MDTPTGVMDAMPDAEYHSHPALSSTGARQLMPPNCPAKYRHWIDHPKPPTDAMKRGTAAHRIILGAGQQIDVHDVRDWKTKAARELRDESEAAGHIALTTAEYAEFVAMRDVLHSHPTIGRLFDADRGKPEQSLFWTDSRYGVPCRARIDWMPNRAEGKRLVVVDYKTSKSAEPSEFARSAATFGYAQQADFYMRGLKALGIEKDPAFVFVTQETEAPYLVSITQITPDDMSLAHHLNDRALWLFKQCRESGVWPGYPEQVVTIGLPAWWRINAETIIDQEDEEDQ
ncbi:MULTISPECIES: PD-(D/E)XK nuclease-like domain-containing protein [unclassified Luteococcus]|uniref:PD-(D/E)XK nuclease-like domain-containing protein n=1 Tax=unclassified Luteococcus TaxID=2639923 RepID=UPI00313B17E8